MSRKHFSWLIGLTVVAVVIVGLLPERLGREATYEARPLLPDLAGRVNDIAEVAVVAAASETVATLRRSDGRWTVVEASGYPADWPKLRGLLAALAQAETIEPKTGNPEYFDRLGLRDVVDEDSRAVLVRLGSGEGAEEVLVGDEATNRDGQYVRLAGGDRAWLIDRTLDVPKQTRDWLERTIVDIAETEVVEVEIVHPDGETVVLKKASADDADFMLQDVPEGREVQSTFTVNAPAGGLSGLRLDDVRRVGEIIFDEPVRLRVLTADSLLVNAQLEEVDGKFWIRLEASVYEPPGAASSAEAVAAEGGADAGAGPGVDDAAPEPEADADHDADALAMGPEARAAAIEARVSGWVYAIPQYKFDVLTRRMDDLLRAEPEE